MACGSNILAGINAKLHPLKLTTCKAGSKTNVYKERTSGRDPATLNNMRKLLNVPDFLFATSQISHGFHD